MKQFLRGMCAFLAMAVALSGAAVAESEMELAEDTPLESAAADYRTLRKGDRDSDDDGEVRRLQETLAELGYYSGKPDGVFDEKTAAAVKDFQLLNGLPDTGVADVDTQVMLFSGADGLEPAPTPVATPRVNGVRGDDVRVAQEALALWGFLAGQVDGKYGGQTERAIKAYKTYVFISEWNYAESHPTPGVSTPEPTPEPTPFVAEGEQPIVVDHTLEPTPTPAPTPPAYNPNGEIDDDLLTAFREESFQVYRGDLQKGSKGSDVTRLQTRLWHLGYLYNGADGDFGAQTERALKYFQRRNSLPETGKADEITQRILFSAMAVESTEYVFPYKLVVDVSDQKVYAYAWNGEKYDSCERTMVCSTGTRSNPTPLGTYQAGGKCGGEWYYFKDFGCYAKYAFRIIGGILFHSVLYNSKSNGSLVQGSVRALGSRASHGCVRLSVENAKWICDNCPAGTTVVVQN